MLIRLVNYDIVCQRIVHLASVQLLLIQPLVQLFRPRHESSKQFVPRVDLRPIVSLSYTGFLSRVVSVVHGSLLGLFRQQSVDWLVVKHGSDSHQALDHVVRSLGLDLVVALRLPHVLDFVL